MVTSAFLCAVEWAGSPWAHEQRSGEWQRLPCTLEKFTSPLASTSMGSRVAPRSSIKCPPPFFTLSDISLGSSVCQYLLGGGGSDSFMLGSPDLGKGSFLAWSMCVVSIGKFCVGCLVNVRPRSWGCTDYHGVETFHGPVVITSWHHGEGHGMCACGYCHEQTWVAGLLKAELCTVHDAWCWWVTVTCWCVCYASVVTLEYS